MILDDFYSGLENAEQNSLRFILTFHSDSRYISYEPDVKELQKSILDMYKKYFENRKNKLKKFEFDIIDYSPDIIPDKHQIELLDDCSKWNIKNTIDNQIMNDTRSMTELENLDTICFSVTETNSERGKILIFSLFHKPFKTKYSLKGMINHNSLKESKDKIIDINSSIEAIYYNDKLLVLNHNAMEKIFFFKDYLKNECNKFIQKITDTQRELINNGEIQNEIINEADLEYLRSYYRESSTRMIKVWRVNNDPKRIEKFISHIDNFKNVKKQFPKLQISFDTSKHILKIPHNPTSISQLLNCMTDKYYLSILFNEPGIASTKK